MKSKTLAIVVAIIFLLTQIGCATLKNNQVQQNADYSANAVADFDAKWRKDEKEWLLMVLIVLGVAVVLGAAISASSGGNGFSLGVNR